MWQKIWNYLTIFFLGIIAGIIVFIKFLDSPEVQNEIIIKKMKNKNSDGNTTNMDLVIESSTENRKEKRKNKIKIFKRKDDE